MRRALPLLVVLAVTALSGCLNDDSTMTVDGTTSAEGSAEEFVDAIHIDETFGAFPSGMDETWTWTMGDNMSGRVLVEQIPDPISQSGSGSVCYRIEWPQGHQSGGMYNCSEGSFGNMVVSAAPSTQMETMTVYQTDLLPNDFTLRVWSNTQDTVNIRVLVETWHVED